MSHPSLRASARVIAEKIRARVWSSREVVDAHIAVIERVNPTLRAVVRDRFALARAEADRADRLVESSNPADLGALHGVPCTIKEAFALEGMPNSSGLLARRHVIADRDAVAVARLRAQGAIPLGVTNVSELCMWYESDNRVYGRTGSAFAPDRTCGGSSGGEGAIVGAGGSPFGLGSDVGGSIRIPAFFNGVYGHKPSGGCVPGTGQYPMAHGSARTMLATGPICRDAEDLDLLLSVLRGPDGEDDACVPMEARDPDSVPMASLRVLLVDEPAPLRASAPLRAAVERAGHLLARQGARVERRSVPELRRAIEIWAATLSSSGGPSYTELLGQGRPVRAGREFLKGLFGRSEFTLPSSVLALLEKIPALKGEAAARVIDAGRALRRSLDALLGDDGVMIFPPHARTAPPHGRPLWTPLQWGHTAIVNALALPATAAPMGFDDDMVPLGVQIIGAHGRDHLCMATAIALQHATGRWAPPPWTTPATPKEPHDVIAAG
jgi:fatty acid amide hydrolase 2